MVLNSPNRFRVHYILFLFLLLPIFAPDSKSEPPQILSFSPTGYTKDITAVVVEFSTPMISLGDPRPKEDIFSIECPFPGKASWLSSSTWVYTFESKLPGGVRCNFQWKSEIRTLKGESLQGEKAFSFHTGGTSVSRIYPYQESSIEEDAHFILELDGKPDLSSLRKLAYFAMEGLESPIGIEVISGELRKKILKSRYFSDSDRTIVLKPKQNFVSKRRVTLFLPKGIVSEYGVASEVEETFNYSIRSPLNFSYYCERHSANSHCIPILPIQVSFSEEIPRKYLEKIRLKSGNTEFSPEIPETEKSITQISFPGDFPEKSELKIIIPEDLEDITGRRLEPVPAAELTIKVGGMPPLAKFPGSFGILEANAAPALPITVRNLEVPLKGQSASLTVQGSSLKTLDPIEIQKWFEIIAKSDRETSVFTQGLGGEKKSFQLPKANPAKSMEVIGIPFEKPGFYVVEVSSEILGRALLDKKQKMFVNSSVLVTNLSIHFKWGIESSVAWVTNFDKGSPEQGVLVKLVDCKGSIYGTGITGKDGIVRFGKLKRNTPYCGYGELSNGLIVFAQKGEDVSFTSTTWERGMETWRFQLPTVKYHPDDSIKSVILDRTLLRAGEKLHMQFVMREPSSKGLLAADPKKYPKNAYIVHLGSEEAFKVPLVWSFPGTAEAEYQIPKLAKLGGYEVQVETETEYKNRETLATFRVEEFKLPVLRGTIALADNKTELISPKNAKVDVSLRYLSGGGVGKTSVKLRSRLVERYSEEVPGYEGFSFENALVETGVFSYGEDSEEDELQVRKSETNSIVETLDSAGFASIAIPNLPRIKSEANLEVEMEYNDPNGLIQTAFRSFPVYMSGVRLGIKPDGWMASKDKVSFQVLALDTKGKPVANQKIKIKYFSKKNYSNRKRLVGGFYSYEHFNEIKELGSFCSGKSNEAGIVFCDGKVNESGELLFVGETEDKQGNLSQASLSLWIASSEDAWFEATDHHRMDIIPDKTQVEVGGEVKIQVRSPFREGTALVTVEREGVLSSFVQTVSGKDPTVTVPILKEYAPNVFISVLLVRGRVGEPKPTAMVDLGKPAFRIGIASVRVGWKPFQLNVNVQPKGTEFKVRDTVNVSLSVIDAEKNAPKGPLTATVFAVDEALLELASNPTVKLLDSMMGIRDLDVSTSTNSTQVIGKRHFGLKARRNGGGGGRSVTRELFDTLVFWQGKVTFDKNGKAQVTFPLNDSLTSFRIFAVAQSGTQEFGTGQASIRTSQEIQVFSSVTPILREGDSAFLDFRVRNATKLSKNLTASLTSSDGSNFEIKSLRLEPESSQTVRWNQVIPPRDSNLDRNLTFEIKDEKNTVVDRLKVSQILETTLKERVYQGNFFQWTEKVEESIKAPEDAQANSSFFQVRAFSSLLTSTKSVDSFFQSYPYKCLEQEVSKSIGLKDQKQWKRIDTELSAYFDSNGLLKFFPKMEYGSEILSAYVLKSSHLAGFNLSPEHKERLVEALSNYLQGNLIGVRSYSSSDSLLRRLVVMEALSYSKEFSMDQVRPLVKHIQVLPNPALIDLLSLLQRVQKVDPKLRSEVLNQLRARTNTQGTEIVLSENDSPWWLMGSPDYTYAKLAFLSLEEPGLKSLAPKIIQGFIRKQNKGKWDTTLANAYGVLVFEKAGKTLEVDKVQGGKVSLQLNTQSFEVDPQTNEQKKLKVSEEQSSLTIDYAGKGKPWIAWQSMAKLPLKTPIENGYRIQKSILPIERKSFLRNTVGDIVRVKLEITAEADKTWVVIEDPIPANASHMGRGMGETKVLPSGSISQSESVSPTFEEKSFSMYRAYFEYLPAGKWVIEYTIRYGLAGEYKTGATRVEAMYSPDAYGELPNSATKVSDEEN